MGTFEAHLMLEGKRSPFAVMTQNFTTALSTDTKTKAGDLSIQVSEIFEQIHAQLHGMVDEKIEDDGEEELRKKFRIFLDSADNKFLEIKADLARIKRRYMM